MNRVERARAAAPEAYRPEREWRAARFAAIDASAEDFRGECIGTFPLRTSKLQGFHSEEVGNAEVALYERWAVVIHAGWWPSLTPIVGLRSHVDKEPNGRVVLKVGGPVGLVGGWPLLSSAVADAGTFAAQFNATAESAEMELSSHPELWGKVWELIDAIWDDGELRQLEATRQRVMDAVWKSSP